ncbi:hypothetical protein PgNI_05584 [Pyricularia grisea]|uniref:Presequence protease, mitochondrial n=1 Tax=Pyricularia grisea TaxID=148305 RepID=A0A6P8B6X1_PYRGI|nr:hypothetical protein PgNI_05584 [Pyricularia grisea]TLD11062.1 hypothetical protein PgNI_05584 [Pyricularia grisea]
MMLRRAALGARGAGRSYATVAQQFPQPGERLHGFTMKRVKHVPELKLTALELQHDKTGAEHLHIARDDSNNVFSIGFKTNPPDDTGVPHILEHTTLCGSEKYPIRDPFFKMLPRTLSNFMNAFTASDHTFYPFATTNAKDFQNLMSVYMDATLNPLLKKTDFWQEGWRVGPENPEALAAAPAEATPEDKRLVFKGVVYNEMKGQMSDASYLFYIRFQDHIFPDINNSGGDPQKITDLTYEQLKRFHADHYHPSNAKLFTYGDMPLADHLREIDAQLSAFDKLSSSDAAKVHRPIDLSNGPRDITMAGPTDPLVDPNRQHKSSVSWVLGDTGEIVESFSLSLISALLMDGYGSPLYKGLIESGLGIAWTPNSGYDNSAKDGIFSIGLTGLQEQDVPKVKTEVQRILSEVRQQGFKRSKIDGYLHQIELGLKHKTANFGMSLLQRVKPKWFNGVDVFDTLAWNETIDAFEKKMAEGGYLEGLMDRYLLNDNTLTFTMTPSADFGAELGKEEEARLAAKISEVRESLGGEAEAQKALEERELLLLAEQSKSTSEDLSCLPTVRVSDIPRRKEPAVVRHDEADGFKTMWHEAPTNGLTYFRSINTFENLPQDLRELIPLFTDAINRLGTKDLTMEELEDRIKLLTGGNLSVGYHAASSPNDFTQASEGLTFSGMVLDRNVQEMYELLRLLVLETNFDSPDAVSHIRQLLKASTEEAINQIADSGHSYARSAAEAGLSTKNHYNEQVGGLSQIKLLTSLAGRPESDQLEDIIGKLKTIQRLAFNADSMRTFITCGSESIQQNQASLSKFMGTLPRNNGINLSSTGQAAQSFPRDVKAFYPLPYQVYYGALAVPTSSYTSKDSAPLLILSQMLTHRHLHHEIREKGGAYGGGAYARSLEGIFGFYSYRDPNPVNTLKIMRNAGRWAVDKQWTDRDLEEAKISVFKSVDAPKDINAEGMGQFLYGVTEEMAHERRARLLDVTREQVQEVAQKYVVESLDKQAERVAFLGQKAEWVDGSWATREMNVD